MDYKIRPATKEELEIPIEWAAKEGWNPGLHDADSFYAVDNKGFYLGFLDGKPISSLSAVAYDNTFGFLGFYIVKPEFRGKGYGFKLWKETLKHLPTQNIGLDGVIAQQENYKKSGFKLAYRNIRYEGDGSKDSGERFDTVELLTLPFEQVKSYDDQIFPVTRHSFLRLWIKQPESLAVCLLKDNELKGYGMIRKCRTGYKIAPLFADDKEIADKLFQRLRSFVGKTEPIFLDVPELNKNAVRMAEQYRMKSMFETARMYTKESPEVPLHKVYGVTSFELG